MTTGYEGEIAKEFLRNCFHDGSLDLGDRARLREFCRIFAGEMEAVIAIEHASWLDRDEALAMIDVAKPTNDTLTAAKKWRARAIGRHP